MDGEAFLSLLQFSDGLFPAGSYAHSFGLETYTANRTIRDAAGLECFLRSYLRGSVAPMDAIAALASRRAALRNGTAGMEQCIIIDHKLDAMKLAREVRDASRQMGRQVLRVAANLAELFALDGPMGPLFRAVEDEATPGHHAIAFGVVGAALGWPETEMVSAYLYSTCAGLVAGALRLLPLGQLAGQRILWSLTQSITELAKEVQGKDMADVWSFAPGIEIAAMRHANLDARLFRS
jgi:urease accessory protein